MIAITKIKYHGFEEAIRGMRNPLNSWDKSDSTFDPLILGKKDKELLLKLCASGTDHRKALRMITVTMDITAPLYWWKEFDTYKVGTVANSCSTMHTLMNKPFEISDFSFDKLTHLNEDLDPYKIGKDLVIQLNIMKDLYIMSKDKSWWYSIIQLLPSSYNQKRTISLNYEVLLNMFLARKNHKLDEWKAFCEKISHNLPFFLEIVIAVDEGLNEKKI